MKLTPEQLAADESTSPQELTKLANQSIRLARIVARNANAEPELLTELATNKDSEIRQGVASNPNAPIDVLFELGEEFPEQFLDNPVFSLLIVENQNLFAEIPLKTLRSLARQDKAPLALIIEYVIQQSQAGLSKSDLEFLLKTISQLNPSKEALERLTKCRNYELAEAARLHVNYTGGILHNWVEIAESSIVYTIKSLHGSLLPKQIQSLATAKLIPEKFIVDWHENRAADRILHKVKKYYPKNLEESENQPSNFDLVKNPKTTVDVFERLVRKGDKQLNLAIANSYYTPVSVLGYLAQLKDAEIAQAIANNPLTPKTILNKLGRVGIYSEAAKEYNHNIEQIKKYFRKKAGFDVDDSQAGLITRIMQQIRESIQIQLTNSLGGYMHARLLKPVTVAPRRYAQRLEIARDINTPARILEELAKDTSLWNEIAIHPNTSTDVLTKLLEDGNTDIKLKCLSNLKISANILKQYSKSNDEYILVRIAKHPNASVEVLGELSQKQSLSIRKAIISNPSTPIRLLQTLAQSEDLLPAFADNPRAPAEVLERLLRNTDRSDVKIWNAIACNPATPSYLLEYMDSNIQDRQSDRSVSLLKAIAIHPNTPVKILESLFLEHIDRNIQDWHMQDWQSYNNVSFLKAIATNPNTPVKILESLVPDRDRDGYPIFVAALTKNSNLPEYLWKSILHYDYSISRYEYNRRFSGQYQAEFPELLPIFLTRYPQGLPTVLEHFANSEFLLVRLIVLNHPQVSLDILVKASNSVYWLDRYAVTQNPSATVELLETLANDSNSIVRAAAKASLKQD